MARKGLFRRYDPSIDVNISHVEKIIEEWTTKATSDLFFRDFMYDDLDLCTPFGGAVDNFLMTLPVDRHFPSLSDEFLSDKSYIANVDELVRSGHAADVGFEEHHVQAWKRWMAPSAQMKAIEVNSSIGFEAPYGFVIKPSKGYGGTGVSIASDTEGSAITNVRRTSDSLIIQKFYRTRTYPLRTGNHTNGQMHIVHGVFLFPNAEILTYGGTFTRLSPNQIVSSDGEVALYLESEWFE